MGDENEDDKGAEGDADAEYGMATFLKLRKKPKKT